MPGLCLGCRVPLGLDLHRAGFLNFPLFVFLKIFSKNSRIHVQKKTANKNGIYKFFISAKEEFKNRTL
jgi:hypothetical protein